MCHYNFWGHPVSLKERLKGVSWEVVERQPVMTLTMDGRLEASCYEERAVAKHRTSGSRYHGGRAPHPSNGGRGITRAHRRDEKPERDVSSYLFTYLPRNYDTPVVASYFSK